MLLKYIEARMQQSEYPVFTEFVRFKKDVDEDQRNQIKRASLPSNVINLSILGHTIKSPPLAFNKQEVDFLFIISLRSTIGLTIKTLFFNVRVVFLDYICPFCKCSHVNNRIST